MSVLWSSHTLFEKEGDGNFDLSRFSLTLYFCNMFEMSLLNNFVRGVEYTIV